MPYKLGSRRLALDVAWTHTDGRQFPANFLRLSTQAERDALGLLWEEPTVTNYDQRFYWGPENPKDLAELKALWTAKVKDTAGKMLSETDWYVVRQAENSAAVPAEVLSRRGEIRTFSNEKEAAIAACADVAALAEYVTGSEYSRWEPLPPEPEPEPTPEPTPEPEATPEPTPTETPEETPAEE